MKGKTITIEGIKPQQDDINLQNGIKPEETNLKLSVTNVIKKVIFNDTVDLKEKTQNLQEEIHMHVLSVVRRAT